MSKGGGFFLVADLMLLASLGRECVETSVIMSLW